MTSDAQRDACRSVIGKLKRHTNGPALEGVIHGEASRQPAVHTPIQRNATLSYLGSLDASVLPAELLCMILELCDFQSLARLSQTSLLARQIIEELPAYKLVMKYAPYVLTVLGRTRLLGYHACGELSRVLKTEECMTCGRHFGGYLCLPSCERMCLACNSFNRVTTFTSAKRSFSLTNCQLEKIPVMLYKPNMYEIPDIVPCYRDRPLRLVSVKQAKQLAIRIHGSAEAARALGPQEPRSFKWISWNKQLLMGFHDIPMGPVDDLPMTDRRRDFDDRYRGMAAIRFPTLTDGGPDYGALCRGCQVAYREYLDGGLPQSVRTEITQAGDSPLGAKWPIPVMENRLWSRARFAPHVRRCHGVPMLLKQWEAAGDFDLIRAMKPPAGSAPGSMSYLDLALLKEKGPDLGG